MIWAAAAAVFVVLTLLGRTRLGILGEYTRQGAGVWLRVGPGKWKLYPWKESGGKKPQKPEKESPKSPEQVQEEQEPKPPVLSPNGMFQLARRLLPVALEGANAFRRRLRVDVLRLEILVGAPDPAETAERYGQVNALLGAVWEPVTQAFHVQDGRVHVGVDFDRQEPALYGKVSLSLTASQLLWLGLQYGPRMLGIFLQVRKQDKAAATRRRKAA